MFFASFFSKARRITVIFSSVMLIFSCFTCNIFAEGANFSPSALTSSASVKLNQENYAVGSIPANFEVTNMGQAHYVIPIELSPGTAHFEPKINLEYSSLESNLNSKNNILGTGFSLTGLDKITRCMSNLAQNGVIHGVDFSNEDKFCLRGEQLVAVKGEYGMDGTEYKLYHDDQSRIISHGRKFNSPDNFTVEKRDGSIEYYGNTQDSQMQAQGRKQGEERINFWAVNKIKNSSDNYFEAHYSKDEAAGSFYPKEINYTGNEKAGLTPYNLIKFIYENNPRPDIITKYQAGSKEVIDKRLEQIQIYQEDKLMRNYKLAYEISQNTSRSRLINISQCDGNNFCLAPTQFKWQVNEEGWVEAPNFHTDIAFRSTGMDLGARILDLNGDGLPDLVQATLLNGQVGQFARINTGTGWVDAPNFRVPSIFTQDGRDLGEGIVDLNGDGLPGVIQMGYDKDARLIQNAWINKGSGWVSTPSFNTDLAIASYGQDLGERILDLNGDGLPDVIQSTGIGGTDFRFARLNTGNGWVNAPNFRTDIWITETGKDLGARILDLNGDGLPDMIQSVRIYGAVTQRARINTGKEWVDAPNFKIPSPTSWFTDETKDDGSRILDLNGDGLPDVIQTVYKKGQVIQNAFINNGNGWVSDPNFKTGIWISQEGKDIGTRIVDLNGDGLPDIVQSTVNSGQITSAANLDTGRGWIDAPNYKIPFWFAGDGRDFGGTIVDLNGDGLPDLMQTTWDYGKLYQSAYLNKAQKLPDYLIKIKNGLGDEIKIDYEPLSGKKVNVYTKEHEAKYPAMDWQGPMYVVYQITTNEDVTDPKAIERLLKKAKEKGIDPKDALNRNVTYHYTGMKKHHLGWGFLGFHKIETQNDLSGLKIVKSYSLDPNQHNLGKEIASETRLGNGKDSVLIDASQNTWEVVKSSGDGSPNATSYFSYLKEAKKHNYDLNGTLLSTGTHTITIDRYNNPAAISTVLIDASGQKTYTTQIANKYANFTDSNRWQLGLLKERQETRLSPNIAQKQQAQAKGAEASSLSRAASFTKRAQWSVSASIASAANETHLTRFNYDLAGLLLSEIANPDTLYSIEKIYKRDNFGNMISSEIKNYDGSIDRINKQEFDSKGRFVIKKINALGQAESYVMSAPFGKPMEKTDSNGLKTSYVYDTFGKLIQENKPEGTQVNIRYSWTPSKPPSPSAEYSVYFKTTETTGKPIRTEYFDHSDRLIAKSKEGFDERLIWETQSYDESGKITRKSLPYFETSQENNGYIFYLYDPIGRLIQEIEADGSVSVIVYDGLTKKVLRTYDQDFLESTLLTFDIEGKLIQVTDHYGKIMRFEYDEYGRLLSKIDSLGNRTNYAYDLLGHVKNISDSDKGEWQYQYNILGELIKQTDAKGNNTSFEYDNLGRLIARTDNESKSKFIYGNDPEKHNVGLLIREEGTANKTDVIKAKQNGIQNYTKSIEYDDKARIISTEIEMNGQRYLMTMDYDSVGNISQKHYPNNFTVQYQYNSKGYLLGIQNPETLDWYYTIQEMDARDHVIKEGHSNGLVTRKIYNPVREFLEQIRTEKPLNKGENNKNIQNLHYHYDRLSNLINRNDDQHHIEEVFIYDSLNRLTKWQAEGAVEEEKSYRYDDIGNLIYQSGVGNYFYTGAMPHALTQIKDDQGKEIGNFKYDQNGNLMNHHWKGKEVNIAYTSYDKPLQIISDTARAEFSYDANREVLSQIEQVQKENNRTITTTRIKLGEYELEKVEDGKQTKTYQKIYLEPYLMMILNLNDRANSPMVYQLMRDGMKSVVEVVDSKTHIFQSYFYYPFGRQDTLGQDIDPLTHQSFKGSDLIQGFDLINMQGRLYDPILGKFLSAIFESRDLIINPHEFNDAANPFEIVNKITMQKLNHYSYALNNPMKN